MSVQDMRREITDAVQGGDEGTADTAEATNADLNDPGDVSPGGEADGSTGATATSENPPAGEVTEVPTEYFGYEFPPDLSPEERADIISEFKKRDDRIGTLLRERGDSTEGETQPEVETPEPIPELTDVEILQALNLDPDNNPFDEATAKIAVPLVRRQVQQEQTIASLVENLELTQIDRTWRSSLEGLEKEYGALPPELNHEAVMEYAAENSIGSPVDAYWRIMGPGRAQLDQATRGMQAKRLAAAKSAASGTRPGTTAADDEAPVVAQTTKGATKEVATRLLKDLGLA
jgi:hypothetical protein